MHRPPGRRNGRELFRQAPTQTGSKRQVGEPTPWSKPAGESWVLLVDDDPINRCIGEAQLTALGFSSTVAASGHQALMLQFTRDWAAVLMDCEMPGLDGYQTVRRWRCRERGRQHTPIIAYTAQDIDRGRDRCLAAGMDDCMAKPSQTDDLGTRLRYWLELAWSRKSTRRRNLTSAGLEKTIEIAS